MTDNLKNFLGYLLITLIWGSTWLAIRFGLDSLTPIFSAGLRFLLASILIYSAMRVRKIKLQTDILAIKLYIAMAFLSFVFPFGMVYWAEQHIPSGLTSVLFSSFPFFVIFFSFLMIKNSTIGFYKIIGSIIGFIGIIVIFLEDISLDFNLQLTAMIMVVSSALIQGLLSVIMKKYGGHLNPLSMNFMPLLIAGIVMVPFGIIFEDSSSWNFTIQAILSISYLAFMGTLVAFSVYYWLMKRINLVILSLSSLITPVIALLLGWIILGENFTSQNLQGSALVLVGIFVANLEGIRKYIKSRRK